MYTHLDLVLIKQSKTHLEKSFQNGGGRIEREKEEMSKIIRLIEERGDLENWVC